jgi:hypothetical protein
VTTDGKEIITQIEHKRFATQEIINSDTLKLINFFSRLTQNCEQKLTTYQKMNSNNSQQTIQNIISDILNKPLSFWLKIRQHPYLTGMASVSLLAIIIAIINHSQHINEFVYNGITH